MLARGHTPVLCCFKRATSAVPIVFTQVIDPIGAGIVASCLGPAATPPGLCRSEYPIGGKWLEVLKGLVPRVEPVGMMMDVVLSDQPRPGLANLQ